MKHFGELCKKCNRAISHSTGKTTSFTPKGIAAQRRVLASEAYKKWTEEHPLQRVTVESRKAGLCAECFEGEVS